MQILYTSAKSLTPILCAFSYRALVGNVLSPQEDVMENMVGQCLLYITLLALLAYPLGIYMGKVMDGEPFWLQTILALRARPVPHPGHQARR